MEVYNGAEAELDSVHAVDKTNDKSTGRQYFKVEEPNWVWYFFAMVTTCLERFGGLPNCAALSRIQCRLDSAF